MSREILFKAKEIDTGEWVYGHYSEGVYGYHYITKNNGSVWLIDINTLGQFTGLTDKNDVKIFEGDIIYNAWNNKKYFVEFSNGLFYMCINDLDIYPISYMSQRNLAIIGNIHDEVKE